MTDIRNHTWSFAKPPVIILTGFILLFIENKSTGWTFIAELEAKTCLAVGQYIPLVLIVYLFIGSTEEMCIGVSLEGSTVLRPLE